MSARKSLFMGTTDVPAERSAGAITDLLVQGGAVRVSMQYAERKIVGIDFVFVHGKLEFPFTIPARVDVLFQKFWTERKYRESDRPQVMARAERVAWRQLFRWVEAQVALIETGMVSTVQVFTPYMLAEGNRTVFDLLMEQRQKLLPGASRS